MFRTLALGAVILSLLPTTAGATSYAPLAAQDVYSQNHRFVLRLNPKKEQHMVYATDDRTRVLWSFPRKVWLERYILSNSGESVAVVSWEYVGADDLEREAFQLWTAAGKKQSYRYRDLVTQPARISGRGPIGSHWRQWFSDVSSDGDLLTIRTTGVNTHVIDLRTGEFQEVKTNWPAIARGVIAGSLILGALLLLLGTRHMLKTMSAPLQRRAVIWTSLCPIFGLLTSGVYLYGIPLVPPILGEVIYYILTLVWFIAIPLGVIGLIQNRTDHRVLRRLLFVVGLLSLPLVWVLYFLTL